MKTTTNNPSDTIRAGRYAVYDDGDGSDIENHLGEVFKIVPHMGCGWASRSRTLHRAEHPTRTDAAVRLLRDAGQA